MNKLRLYRVEIEYIKYLYKFDNRVQYDSNKEKMYTAKRPYLGIVLNMNNLNYFVPLEHPRKEHQKMKKNLFIYKIHNGKYGILGFNNMIPIPNSQLIKFDINQENEKYRQILISQYHFCNKHIEEIMSRAKNTYIRRINEKNKFLIKICCDFELLEQKCKEYEALSLEKNTNI